MRVRLRIQLPARVKRFFGSLRCVLNGHTFGGLFIEDGALYSRCVDCGQLSDGVRVHTPVRGGR